jgi:3-isopropylmalate dehydratase small subunit
MGLTLLEKILSSHSPNGSALQPGDIVDLGIDARIARDFGGANVVKRLIESDLGVDDPSKTFFTFDCNPTGSDQKYATNQEACREYARLTGIRVFDINAGIGTHLAINEGLVAPGATMVSTDSHANILGAIGAFGQGMGDVDVAHAFAFGKVWFKVPESVKVVFKGTPGPEATPKDLILATLAVMGAGGLLGCAAEFTGKVIDELPIAGRVTMASMATEMGGIIALFEPNESVLEFCRAAAGHDVPTITADADAQYARVVEVDVEGLGPMVSRPGHPEDVAPVSAVRGTKIGSAFIGSCTNGRIEDLRDAAEVLKGRHAAPGVVLKIVPSTDEVWQAAMHEGLFEIFKAAGALISNAGCGGCASGQVGQNGAGEVTISTGNRNFAGKQGQGEVFLASPRTVAASAVAGVVTSADQIPAKPVLFAKPSEGAHAAAKPRAEAADTKPRQIEGRVWVIREDNIDTDMIFHNQHLAITDLEEMGQHTFGNLDGWRDFPKKVQSGDIVVVGANFGAGSSRQQAVDCFRSLGVALIIAESYGAIYERNAINSGFPILTAPAVDSDLTDGERISVDLETGILKRADGREIPGRPFAGVQMQIYQRGGLLVG